MTLAAACSRLASYAEFSASECGCSCTLEQSVVEEALDHASDLVYYLTKGTWFGVCEATVRPCRQCYCGTCRSCCELEVLPLRADAIEVSEVRIDGVVLDTDEYELLRGGRLVRRNPSNPLNRPDPWPCCQKVYRPLTADETFGLTYSFGQGLIPGWVKNAVIELACDTTTHFETGRTKLPPGTTAATMQNVTITLQAQADALRDDTVLAEFPAVATLLGLCGPGRGGWVYAPGGASAWSLVTA